MKKYKSIYKESKNLPSSIVKDYERRANAERRAGTEVEINYNIPYIAVGDYYFQGQEAEEMLDEVPGNIDAEDYFLVMYQGW